MNGDLFVFACPVCGTVLERVELDLYRCPKDGLLYERIDGIWRFLPPKRGEHFAKFVHEYETIRQAEGRTIQPAEFYRQLPFVDKDNRQFAFWRGREESYQTLLKYVVALMERPEVKKGGEEEEEKKDGEELGLTQLKVLDVGAGNGWMSYSLEQIGHRVAAVDLLINDADGLGAHIHYDLPFTTLQGEFDRLPLADDQFDLVIFNASFHYAVDYGVTLAEAMRVVRPRGRIVIVDTPLYGDAEAGMEMVEERKKMFTKRYGFPSDAIPAQYFLTRGRLDELAGQIGWSYRLIPVAAGWRRLVRRGKRLMSGDRESAEFPLVVWREDL